MFWDGPKSIGDGFGMCLGAFWCIFQRQAVVWEVVAAVFVFAAPISAVQEANWLAVAASGGDLAVILNFGQKNRKK